MFAFADQIKIKKKKAIGGGSHSTLIQIEKRGDGDAFTWLTYIYEHIYWG